MKDTSWIKQLPICPCTVIEGSLPCTVRPTGSSHTGSRNAVNWDTDKAANTCVDLGYHPGANACIRAAGPGNTGQQCCYGPPDDQGVFHILEHGSPGAGTPDRNVPSHIKGDVNPYEYCCTDCPKLCPLYLGKSDGTQGARSDPRHSSSRCEGP